GPGGMQPPGQGGTNQQGTGRQGTGMGQPPTGTPPGQGTSQNQGQNQGQPQTGGTGQNTRQRGATPPTMGERGGAGGMGGLLNGASVGSKAKALLEKNADDYTWAAAAIGSQNAASYQLATEKPVMAIGGFNGSDPSPTLAQFKKYVEDGRIHYFVSGGGMGGGMGGSGSGTASQISSWVEENFKEVTAGSATFYDLTQPKTSS
ncbi:glycosyl transferase, partial [Streptomyces sp. SID9124]|nr:glycosyl transferase [Streptomyces sp. SID9124]